MPIRQLQILAYKGVLKRLDVIPTINDTLIVAHFVDSSIVLKQENSFRWQ
jgi:hypothetical protein